MTDRVYPSTKPPANGTTTTNTTAAANPSFPATKAQLYGATRPAYRPQPKRHRYRRSCCCSCCIWVTLTIILLILLAAIAGGILYALYRPHRPSFSVSSLKIQTLNITSSQTLVTNITLSVNSRNPNKELVFYYDPISISLTTANDDNNNINVGVGSFPSFKHGTKNTTVLNTAIIGSGQALDDASASKLKLQLKSKSGLPLKVKLETKVKVKMGVVKSPKVRIRVICEGITATAPTGKTASLASTSNAKCKVDLRIKIWKWTF